jgi:hypothetical protein
MAIHRTTVHPVVGTVEWETDATSQPLHVVEAASREADVPRA